MEKLLNLVISGAVSGAIYSVMASGLVLTYQSSGIFNFAHGAIAFATAYLYFQLHAATADGGLGWPIVPSAIVAIFVFAPLLGLLLDRILLRRLADAPVYARIVGTIGLLVAFPAVVLWLVDTVGNSVLELGLPTNVAGFRPPGLGPVPSEVVWRPLSGVAVNSDQLAVFLAAGAAAVLLWLVLRHTRVGLEMRAGVDRRELAGLRGVNAAKTSAVAWALSMTLAGLGGVLIAPLFGLTDVDYTLVVLGSLAAVVAAGLRSIPLAFAAGLALGVLQNLVFGYAPDFLTDISGFLSSIPFLLTIVLLFFLGFDRTRAAGSVADESPPEDHRAGLPPWRRILPWTIAVSALVVYELWFANEFWSSLIAKGIVLGIVFLSFVVITGLGGMVSLGQATFVTASAFTVGYLVNTEFGFTIPLLMHDGRFGFFVAVLAGTAVAAAVGAVIAIPVRRLGPLALALATLSFAFTAELIVFQLDAVRNGSRGWPVPPLNLETFESELPLGPFDFTQPRELAMLALLVFGAITVVIYNLRGSTSGRAVLAVRSSEVAARTSGIGAGWSKVSLFAVSAGIAGLGGALLAVVSSPVNNRSAPAFVGLIWLAVTVTFGIRRPGGALLAGLAFACFTDLLQVIAGWGFMPDWAATLTETPQLAAILFGIGAINLAKNPDGVLALVGMQRLERRRRREQAEAARAATPAPAPVATTPVAAPLAPPGGDGAGEVAPAALRLERIVAGYGEVEVLHGVDLSVGKGEVVTLLGANGAGKSTLCAVAAGLLEPTSGRVRLDSGDVTDEPAFRRARRDLVLAPEARGIFPGLSVDENLSVVLRSAREREQAYERFPLLADRRRQTAGLLSGGEQQMLALAPALVRTPAVFVADEPSLGLAPMASEAVFDALTELRQRGSSLLLVEEKAREALALADVVAVMELGRVVWTGPRQEADADRLAAVYLGVRV
ncbi:MAG TPA: ATP-binding cassette domain-containing protein [Acidimicrobiia bacterium]|nr:ATP-binding cassette domain-containing protein [Acidimicrobiia bacterium]